MRQTGKTSRISETYWKGKSPPSISIGPMKGILRHDKVWPHQLIDVLASRILNDSDSDDGFDFSDIVVVLPSLSAASACSHRLLALTGTGVLLPFFTTFDAWSRQVDLPFGVEAKRYRELLIYHELQKYQWLDQGNNWNLAVDMAELIGELDLYQPGIDLDLEALSDRFSQAYQTRSPKLVGFEARLLFDTWNAFAGVREGQASEQYAYRYRLSRLLERETRRLYVLKYPELSSVEQSFIENYASRNCATVLEADVSTASGDARAEFCRSVYQNETKKLLVTQSETIRLKDSPWSSTINYFSAISLDQEVRAIKIKIQQWLAAGKKNIAIVAFDRKVARRLRALLQQSEILVRDEFGWKMSTTSVATTLVDWLELLACDLEVTKLIRFLKRPTISQMFGADQFRVALENALKKNRKETTAIGFHKVAREVGIDQAREVADKLFEVKRQFDSLRSRNHRNWIRAVLVSLEFADIKVILKQDDAGIQLLQLLDTLEAELNHFDRKVSFTTWLDWFKAQLEASTFKDAQIDSPISFTHLSAARLRSFDGVIFAGADDINFPLAQFKSVHFGDGVRAQLDLRTREDFIYADKVDLLGCLLLSQTVFVTWQRQKDNEDNLLSPWFENFRLYHTMLWGDDLRDEELESQLHFFEARQRQLQDKHEPLPEPHISIVSSEIPTQISVRSYQSLLDCPYQFFVQYVLRTREPDSLDADPSKRELGKVIHKVLEKFHTRYPKCINVDLEVLQQEMINIARDTLAALVGSRGIVHGWMTRLRGLFEHYLEWQVQREKDGWTIVEMEADFERNFMTEGGISRKFFGRVDRIDEQSVNGDRKRVVIDYKSRAKGILKKIISSYDEDTQLISYVSLQPDNKTKAMYLALDKNAVDVVELETQDIESSIEEHLNRLESLFSQMEKGQVLPANGAPSICRFCDVQGLCRKDFSWLPE